jgi:hypothetical protein
MNERIKSLLAKAHLDVMEDLGDIDSNYVAEKFAELIVKECIDCAVWVGKNNYNPVEPIHTAHAVKRRIEKHFGVEE